MWFVLLDGGGLGGQVEQIIQRLLGAAVDRNRHGIPERAGFGDGDERGGDGNEGGE